ncbi:MAG: 2-phospho-L-lactate transferase [Acidimicrobiia bacterium]|nr:2-phospho-L-lactate transferase [Acidimicrobiia bacterium]
MDTRVTALAGGVGAARFLRGLLRAVPATDVTVVVNTADDDQFHGLAVSPDLDTVTYTLAGAENPDTGWGLAGDTFECTDALERYGMPTWFRLGDRDLATHLFRSHCFRQGRTLSEATRAITDAWGVQADVRPMSDDPVRTKIIIAGEEGVSASAPRSEELAMQEWFVGRRAEPAVRGIRFDGAAAARPAPGVLEAIAQADSIVVCPSNPVISIGPILAVPGIRNALTERRDHVVGVSPIIGGAPVKGPADRLMEGLGMQVSCVGVATAYADFCGTLVIDAVDADRASDVDVLGVRAVVADTMMRDVAVAAELARTTLAAVA